jgi:hypothetical protein
MLAEKFFLLLETIKSRTYVDGSPRVVSNSPHVPVMLSQSQVNADAGSKPSPSPPHAPDSPSPTSGQPLVALRHAI